MLLSLLSEEVWLKNIRESFKERKGRGFSGCLECNAFCGLFLECGLSNPLAATCPLDYRKVLYIYEKHVALRLL